ncbi:MFS transporter [Fodinicurvata fenggangensis]|uniref:MFS transporter n=1 Tax=Fodinicurvata fenggangensis TaxID=1121830 RepID=UPI000689A6BD|nr:MFS transporter [Fodinicurvata fenggangensis]
MTSSNGNRRLPAAVLAAYGLPGLPLAALQFPLFIHLPAYYAQDLGLGLTAVGAVLLIARLWDVVTDPLIGLLSDRTPGRFGRRKPWLLLGTPLLLLAAWQLLVPGPDVGWGHLLVWTLAIYLAGTLITLPYQAWGAELSPNYNERSRISSAREIFVVLGTLLAAGLPALFGNTAEEALKLITLGLFVTLPLAIAACLVFVPDAEILRRSALTWRQGLQALRDNAPFRRLIAAYLLNGIANGLPATLFVIFVTRYLQLPQDPWVGILLFTYFFCGIAAVPAWLKLSYRFGKHRVWAGAMIWACLVFATVPLLGPGDVWGFFAICVLTGVSLGADLVLPASMQADVVDQDTLQTGERRAGLYFALWGMVTKLALALAVGLSFPLLDLAGFRDQAEGQDALARFALAGLYALVPIAFKIPAIALIARFQITAAEQLRIRRLIEQQQTQTG